MHDLRKTNVGRHGPHHLPLFSRPCNKNENFDTYNSLTPNWYYKVLR